MKSIRRRLMVGLLAGFFILLGSGAVAVYFVTRGNLQAEADAALLVQAKAMAALVHEDQGKFEYDFSDEMLAGLAPPGNRQAFTIRSADNKLLRGSAGVTAPELKSLPFLTKVPSFWDTMIRGHPGRSVGFIFLPQQEENDEDGRSVVTVPPPVLSLVLTQDESALHHTLQLLCAVLAGVGAVTLAGTVLLVAATVRAGLRPLEVMGEQAMRIDATSLDSRFAVAAVPIELRSICERLNDLLSRLDESFRREQRFSADVAHELRTPVAELRALAEVALKWPPSAAESPRAFRDALEVARKMDGIVTGLLALVSCEEGRQPLRLASFAVGALLSKAWAPFSLRAEGKGLPVSFDLAPGLIVRSDPAALEIILTNVFSNAVEYTPANGEITVSASFRDGRLAIACVNSVEGLQAHDLPHLGERFWRKDPARHDSTHSGLGLSIAQKFAELLGAELTVALLAQSQLRLSLILPPGEGGGTDPAAKAPPEFRSAETGRTAPSLPSMAG